MDALGIYGFLFLYCIDTTNMWSLFAMKSMGWISLRNCEGKWSHWTLDWFVNKQEDETILGWSFQILTCFIIFKTQVIWTVFYFVCFECWFWNHHIFCSDSGIPTPVEMFCTKVPFFSIILSLPICERSELATQIDDGTLGRLNDRANLIAGRFPSTFEGPQSDNRVPPRALRVIVHKEKASLCLGSQTWESPRRFRHQNQWIRLGSWDSKRKQLSIISW